MAPNNKDFSGDKLLIKKMIKSAVTGHPRAFNESFEKVMNNKTRKLVKEERSRVAEMVFAPMIKRNLVEEDIDTDINYTKLYVNNQDLFSKEKDHMPLWMQKATVDGITISPIKEKDAIELSKRFSSIEFADA